MRELDALPLVHSSLPAPRIVIEVQRKGTEKRMRQQVNEVGAHAQSKGMGDPGALGRVEEGSSPIWTWRQVEPPSRAS